MSTECIKYSIDFHSFTSTNRRKLIDVCLGSCWTFCPGGLLIFRILRGSDMQRKRRDEKGEKEGRDVPLAAWSIGGRRRRRRRRG
jgi:hypothetical protein